MFSRIPPPQILWFIYLRKEEMKWLLKLLNVSYANEFGFLDHFGEYPWEVKEGIFTPCRVVFRSMKEVAERNF